MMVRDFNSVVGKECVTQMPAMTGRQPDAVIACVGGGSNAMGIFYRVRAARERDADRRGGGRPGHRKPASTRRRSPAGTPGVLHGNRTYLLQDADGQIQETHSISAGLDYPGVGPEHAWLKDTGRARVRDGHRRRGARRPSTSCAASRASFPRSNRATPWRTR